ncbi:hypothetical protein LEP1GSC170_1458 [Leptospira interrogans serovar Bataviae str. HAI135]|nr:hypothetical protein LEP1GSC170_1458 [Leptospira interrogans serovar Bataviae str. HAI135]
MNDQDGLKINDILKLIEIETGPDNHPYFADSWERIKGDADFARFTLNMAHSLIKNANSDEEFVFYLVHLATTAVIWILVLNGGWVKTKAKKVLKINNILKLIELKIKPDSPFHAEVCAKITNDVNFAKFVLSEISDLIKSTKDDERLTSHLIYLVCFAVIWISALNPTKVKEYVNCILGPLSPWAKENTNTSNKAKK